MTTHDEMLERVAGYALGALPKSEVAEVAAHLRECGACSAEYRALASSVSALAASEQACPTGEEGAIVSPLLKARIMRAASQRSPGIQYRVPWVAAAVAAVLVIALLASLYGPLRHREHGTPVAVARRQIYAFSGGEMYVSGGNVYIVARHLRRLPKGRVYQAWALARGAHSVAPSVTFSGNNQAVVRLPQPAATLSAVAISVEPAGGSKHPTTKPIALVRLST